MILKINDHGKYFVMNKYSFGFLICQITFKFNEFSTLNNFHLVGMVSKYTKQF